MEGNKKVKIGNENFKEWLKAIDPQTRVKRIGHISRTLFAMGQQGTQIKRALAQLSQRCQVMIVKLTEKEIQQYTARKPLEKLHHSNTVTLPNHYSHSNFKRPKSVNSSRKRQKRKELFKELFGEDDGEDAKHEPRAKEGSEKGVNYLSTTVHVNYYNICTAPSDGLESDSTNLKRKSFTEKSVIKSNQVPPKKLRIDVSLSSDNRSDQNEEQLVSVVESDRGSPCHRTKNTGRKKSSKLKSSAKKKSKKDHKKIRKHSLPTGNTSTSEEDPSIKELWSILGMESPIDRTARFFLNRSSFSETITLHGALDERKPGEESVMEQRTHNDQNQVENNFIKEPFLRISETFSLAKASSQDGHGTSERDVDAGKANANNVDLLGRKMDLSNQCGENNESFTTEENAIDLGSLQENSMRTNKETEIPKKSNKESGRITIPEEPRSKVGTIRVKSLGLLVDPQLQPTFHENIFPTNKDAQSSGLTINNAEVPRTNNEPDPSPELSLEERFFEVYSFYFDEVVENKIPKLGEYLHLAIADAMRFNERIKTAAKLSSQDYIKTEKLKAEKDFDDSMRNRGFEFTPLCDTIIKRFLDVSSKQTLFYALFCRILKQASTIDPTNEGHITAAKEVIRLMLKKHRYEDKDILDFLKDKDFENQVRKFRQLVERCVRLKDNLATSSASTCVVDDNTFNNPTTSQVSQGSETTNYHTLGLTEQSTKRVQERLPAPGRANLSSQAQSRKTAHINEGSFLNTTVQKSRAGNDPNNLIAREIQKNQQLTNLTTNRTVQPQVHPKVPELPRTVSRNAALVNELELAKQVWKSAVNKQSKATNANNINLDHPDLLLKNTISLNQNQSSQLERLLAAKISETPNNTNLITGPQLTYREFVTPQASLKPVGTPNSAATFPMSKSSSASSSSRISQASISTSTAVKQSQALIQSSSANRSSSENPLSIQYLQTLPVSTSVTVLKVPAPQRPVRTYIQSSTSTPNHYKPRQLSSSLPMTEGQTLPMSSSVTAPIRPATQQLVSTSLPSSTSTGTLSHPVQPGFLLPRQEDMSIKNQQKLNITKPIPGQQPRLNQVTSAVPINVRNVVDQAVSSAGVFRANQSHLTRLIKDTSGPQQPTISNATTIVPVDVGEMINHTISVLMGKNNNQLGPTDINKTHTTNIRPEETSARGCAIPPSALSPSAGSSTQSPSRPETSPTTEVNLPLSSHCHPFIARRPISGKMKMFFGNNTTN